MKRYLICNVHRPDGYGLWEYAGIEITAEIIASVAKTQEAVDYYSPVPYSASFDGIVTPILLTPIGQHTQADTLCTIVAEEDEPTMVTSLEGFDMMEPAVVTAVFYPEGDRIIFQGIMKNGNVFEIKVPPFGILFDETMFPVMKMGKDEVE